MNIDLVNKLQFYGYTVNNRGYVYKHSHTTRRKEVAGQVNNAGVYFYAQNVEPFKQGQNTFKDILGNDKPFVYTPFIPEKTIERNFSFDNYITTTQKRNQFEIYLKKFFKNEQNTSFSNLYDIRGVKNGNFEDATLFPYINYDNEFLTAKIVKYNTNTGKRIKQGFANTWFHAEKSIKKQLGIKEKISKSIDCFFGEHLLPFNNKPVVIVEAEKTAIFLSEIFKNIVFIASGGIAKLERLNYDFLINRKVYLFPDNNATEWFKIAEERGWWVSEILENKGEKGEDVADYILNKDTEERYSIWWELYEELWQIDNNEDIGNIECTSLNFKHKKNISFNYCLPIPKELGLNYYSDNSKGIGFKGKHFQIYEDDFQVLNANIDFNKSYRNETERFHDAKWRQMNVSEFIKNLEKCFRIIKHLNQDKPYKHLFSEILYNLVINSNHTFNISYVERALIPLWDNDNNKIEKYYKFRNWRFFSKETIHKKDFVISLNNDKKLFQTNQYLKKLQPLLNKNKFILPEEIGLHQKTINSYVWNLIKDYNKKVIGCTTLRNYESKLKVSEYLNWWVKNVNRLEGKEVLYIKFCSTYYNTNIDCKKICTIYKIPPISVINDNTGIHRKLITEYFNFQPDNAFLMDLKEVVNYHINNAQEFNFSRENKYIEVNPIHSIEEIRELIKEEIILPTKEAFDYDLDLTDSVLNCTLESAMQQDTLFLFSWIAFHNPELTDEEREEVKYCPMLYFKDKNRTFLQAS